MSFHQRSTSRRSAAASGLMQSRECCTSRVAGGAALLFVLLLPVAAAAQTFWKDLQVPPLAQFQVPAPETFTLKNGLRVFLLEDHALPKVEASVLVRAGAIWEPKDKLGLASVTGQVMRTGGTSKRPGNQIDELLEGLGASIETSIGEDQASASMFVLSEDLATGVEVLAELLREPAFPQDKIDQAKVQERDAISRRNDDPDSIASREFSKLLFGKGSPYARHPEYATVDAIQREDLVEFHRSAFTPDNAMLGVVGDFDSKALKQLLEQHFGPWKAAKGRKRLEMPPVGAAPKSAVHLIPKEDVNQTQLRIGHLGGRRDDPDYFALVVLNEVFGGGSFSSRLMNEVRTKRGLAYGAFGVWAAGWESQGVFLMGSATKSESTVETTRVMVDALRQMTQAEPSAVELQQAKEAILSSFVFNFDTRAEIVSRLMNYAYHGYPADFIFRFKKGVEGVTAADVLRVAKAHLQPDKLVYLAVGKPADFGEPLSALGLGDPVPVDIAIPTPAENVPAADEASLARGRELWAAARAALGGEAIAKVRALRVRGSIRVQSPAGEMTAKTVQTVQYPDKLRMEMELPFGKMSQGFDGKSAWLRGPMGEQVLGGSEAAEVAQDLFLDPVALFQAADLQVQYLGEEAGAAPGWLLRVQAPADPAKSATVKVAKDSSRILELRYRSIGQGGPEEVVDVFSDWREVEGVFFAFQEDSQRGGKPFSSATSEAIELNPEVDEAVFRLK